MRFPSNIINYIRSISQRFVDENLSEESMFFDDIWGAYEIELNKWITKSPKRWKFKGSKIKLPRLVSVSGKTKPLDLDAPKIVDTLVNSIAQIALLKNHFTLEKIKDTIHSCGEKSSDTLRDQVVEFFAPILLKDLQKMELIPVSEKGIEVDSRIGENKPGTEMHEEKKEYNYIMYTDEEREGEKLDDDDYYQLREEYVRRARDYKFIIDEPSRACFFEGENINETGREIPVAPAWHALIFVVVEKQGREVHYKEIFNEVNPEEDYDHYKNKGTVHQWFSLFRKYLSNNLKWLLKGKPNIGYDVKKFIGNYCIFIRNRTE